MNVRPKWNPISKLKSGDIFISVGPFLELFVGSYTGGKMEKDKIVHWMIQKIWSLTVFSQNGFHLASQAIGWVEIAGDQTK